MFLFKRKREIRFTIIILKMLQLMQNASIFLKKITLCLFLGTIWTCTTSYILTVSAPGLLGMYQHIHVAV